MPKITPKPFLLLALPLALGARPPLEPVRQQQPAPPPARAAQAVPGPAQPAAGQTAQPVQTAQTVIPAQIPTADLQVHLDRVGFSPGVIDGKSGGNSVKALAAFQASYDLPVTGKIDPLTWQNLTAASGGAAVATYTITPEDAAGPFVPAIPEDMEEKSKLEALGYTSLLEMLSERFHTTPEFLQLLNSQATFAAGEQIRVPNVRAVQATPQKAPEGTRLIVSKHDLTLTVERGDDVLFFAPVTAGSEHDPLPLGQWKVKGVARNPTFNYNPDLFWDADPSHSKAKIPAGPNNPVGVVWIDIDKEHYGIHGTPEPKMVGKAFSHGCVRLTNWDALTVAGLVGPGTPVIFR